MEKFPETANYLIPNKIHAFDITRVKNYGFFIILENNVTRMWHDCDLVIIYFATNQLECKLKKEGRN